MSGGQAAGPALESGQILSHQPEARSLEFWRAVCCESLAAFLYVLLLCLAESAVAGDHSLPPSSRQLHLGLVAGLAVAALTSVFQPVSGAHISPAACLAAALLQRLSPLRAAAMLVGQCVGAVMAAGLSFMLSGVAREHFPTVRVADTALEFLLTFLAVLVQLGPWDSPGQAGLGSGLAYSAGLAVHRGALNPARALGPALLANSWRLHWVFWVGPALGAVCAALLHHQLSEDLPRKPPARWSGSVGRGGGPEEEPLCPPRPSAGPAGPQAVCFTNPLATPGPPGPSPRPGRARGEEAEEGRAAQRSYSMSQSPSHGPRARRAEPASLQNSGSSSGYHSGGRKGSKRYR